jgi:hypothetical protein
MNGGTGDDAARWIHGLAPLDCLAQAVRCREAAHADGSAQDLHTYSRAINLAIPGAVARFDRFFTIRLAVGDGQPEGGVKCGGSQLDLPLPGSQ